MEESKDELTTEHELPPIHSPRTGWALGAAIGVVVLFVTWGVLAASRGQEPVGSGTFGDAFGALTGLVTALGLVAALYGIYQQQISLQQQRQEAVQARREFAVQLKAAREATEMQREELAMAREEYARQAVAAEESANAMSRLADATLVLAEEQAISSWITAEATHPSGASLLADYLQWRAGAIHPHAQAWSLMEQANRFEHLSSAVSNDFTEAMNQLIESYHEVAGHIGGDPVEFDRRPAAIALETMRERMTQMEVQLREAGPPQAQPPEPPQL